MTEIKKLSNEEVAITIAATLKSFGINTNTQKSSIGSMFYVQCPDYIFVIGQENQPDGYMVHVLADAALAVLVMTEVFKRVKDLQPFGPFARDPENVNNFLTGEAAMAVKTQLIRAMAVKAMVEDGSIVDEAPAEKSKIILA